MRMEGRTGPWEREYAWKEMGVSLSFSTEAHRLAEISEEKNLVRVVWDMDVGKEPGKQSQWREDRGGESALSQCAGEVAGGASWKRRSRQEDPVRKGSRIGVGTHWVSWRQVSDHGLWGRNGGGNAEGHTEHPWGGSAVKWRGSKLLNI